MTASAARKPSNPQFSDIFLRFWRQCNVQIAGNLYNAAHNRCFYPLRCSNQRAVPQTINND